MFVFGPSLLFIGTTTEVIQTAFTAVVGVVCLASGLSGYLISRASPWERGLLLVAAMLLIKPGLNSDLIGFVLIAIAVAGQIVTSRRLREQQAG